MVAEFSSVQKFRNFTVAEFSSVQKFRNFMVLCYRPMIQKKLNVLGKAGLSKENFSAADTTRVKVGSS